MPLFYYVHFLYLNYYHSYIGMNKNIYQKYVDFSQELELELLPVLFHLIVFLFSFQLVKELSPSHMVNSTLTLFGPALIIGNEIALILNYLIALKEGTKESFLTVLSFSMCSVLSLVQIILLLFVFRYDTPLQLYLNADDEHCMRELTKLYLDSDERMAVYSRLKKINEYREYKYPSYSELFSKSLIGSTCRGITISIIRNCGGIFMTMVFASLVYENKTSTQQLINNGLALSNLIGTFIPFIFINRIFFIQIRYWNEKSLILWSNLDFSL